MTIQATTKRRGGYYPPVTSGLVHWWPYTSQGNIDDYVTETTIGSLGYGATVDGDPTALQISAGNWPDGGFHSTNRWTNGRQKATICFTYNLLGAFSRAYVSRGNANRDLFAVAGSENTTVKIAGELAVNYADPPTGRGFLAVVFDGTQPTNATRLQVYRDGVALGMGFTGTIPANLLNDPGYNIIHGGSINSGAQHPTTLNHICGYDRPLTAQEVETMRQWSIRHS